MDTDVDPGRSDPTRDLNAVVHDERDTRRPQHIEQLSRLAYEVFIGGIFVPELYTSHAATYRGEDDVGKGARTNEHRVGDEVEPKVERKAQRRSTSAETVASFIV
jgi:hypothetical protein